MRLVDPAALPDPADRSRALESGNILFFPRIPFAFSPEDQQHLLQAVQTGGDLHKNVAYRPLRDRVSGLKAGAASEEGVRTSLRHFSAAAALFAGSLLPHYQRAWKLDYASFRGIEEEGRDLPWKKRNDLLHTDAFPTRPTNGNLILRFFANINPTRDRVWMTSEPFESVAREYAHAAGLPRGATAISDAPGGWKRAAQALGLPVVNRSRYDEFMLGFHDFLKKNETYQRDCPKFRFHFPPGSAWMVFTDVVPHAVLSGQYAVEQTFIVSKDSLAEPELAPVRILERLSNQRLTASAT